MTTSAPVVRPFDMVLVANRGEIAVRIMRSARASGHRTVAVFSDADADAVHVHAADLAVRLGPAPASESYLDIERVIAAAVEAGAGAIHPGYGFLAENAHFAQACADAGIVFVGPTPDAIRLMGDKAAAKRRMADAGVPMLPGYQGTDQDDEHLLAQARAVGFPLMVKAAAGGGGKGMRLVMAADDLPGAIAAARREARSAFGSADLILERAVLRPRHVEVQVLADTHGHVVALGERDCSVQRRHQKVVEEAPCPVLDDGTRARLHAAAVTAAAEIGYVGAGTVEFLLGTEGDTAGTLSFLEMNTRLQVEHPVTEMVTGLDLVDWQLRIAAGEPLSLAQDDVRIDGHAIEVRLYAEDPAAGFLPQTGRVEAWQAPQGEGIRVDTGVASGSQVTADYDPMIAKVIAHGRDRDEARRRLADALDHTLLLGPRTNRTFLARVLRHGTFAAGDATTAFLDEHDLTAAPVDLRDVATVAGWLHLHRQRAAARRSPGLSGWTNAGWLSARQHLDVAGALHDLTLRPDGDVVHVTVDGTTFEVQHRVDGTLIVDGHVADLDARLLGEDRVLARLPHVDLDVRDLLLTAGDASDVGGAGILLAPMHGVVTDVALAVGDTVAAGDPVVAIEAMKMEHVVRADVDGTLVEVVALGDQVADRDVLARIEPGDG